MVARGIRGRLKFSIQATLALDRAVWVDSMQAANPGEEYHMAFVKFDKGAQPSTTVPTITVQRSGSLSMSRAAYKLLGEPVSVEFYWDADRSMIGVAAAGKDALGSYPVRPNGSPERGPVTVSAVAFTKHIGIDTSEARRWVVKLEDNMLVFDTTAEAQTVKSNRTIGEERRRAEAAADDT